ncbi:ATP-binding cassette domain-containing protein [Streptomyces sp. CMB-StM0423]|uniref:ATP-binding cassette domain-containing protein n=1 Tax=Streptomyces sp. CMB-StM0423 TaxID=2059884 RepID=UPI000C7142CE|nr:ATP-binding cassette domain-containing protein [Streptomyces sp. CMB-StM0423]AUH44576.1 branched-chain amino acid ABC transporter ATP-binding protein [Streptomyces sp. CMB-StM0423]
MLTIEDLHVGYGGAGHALSGLSLQVSPGEVVAVLGSNGAGKTTLLRTISRTLPRGGHVRGRVELDGAPLPGKTEDVMRSGVVHVPEGRRIFPLTVAENLRIGAFSSPKALRMQQRKLVLDLFPELEARMGQPGSTLSGGEQQMLAIGRGLMSCPRLLMLDEPTLGLAPLVIERIGRDLEKIAGQGIAVLLVEQNLALVEIATSGLVLETGRVVASGPAEQLARDELAARYLGATTGNRPDGEGKARTADRTPAGPRSTASQPAAAATKGSAEKGELLVQAEALTLRFGGVTALRKVDLDVGQGTVHAIIGPNGAGKTTLLNVLSGILAPDEGTVRIGGRVLPHRRPYAAAGLGVARAFQNLALYGDRSVEDNLLLGRHHLMRGGPVAFAAAVVRTRAARAEERAHRRRVRELAGQLGIAALLDQDVGELSYGDRKRVEVARAVCMERPVLLLDEPLAGMNREEKLEVAATIRYCHTELGSTVVLVDHDMHVVMDLAQTVTVLDFGVRIAHGPPEQVSADPAVIAAYLGTGDETGQPGRSDAPGQRRRQGADGRSRADEEE